MNDPRFGAALRALRRRRRWRQVDLAAAAGSSQPVISTIEAGRLDETTVATVRAVAAALDATIMIELRWRGAALDRLLDERHAQLNGRLATMLARSGWRVEPEVSYSRFGERGSIDLLAWHEQTAALLVIEVKSELVSVEATLRKLDEKFRLGPSIVRERDERRVRTVGRLLALPSTTTSRRHLARHAALMDRALPDRGTAVRAWLRRPTGPFAGVIFVPETPDERDEEDKPDQPGQPARPQGEPVKPDMPNIRPSDATHVSLTPHRVRVPAGTRPPRRASA
ncbi:MAG: helix-turn-helix domain-containing protein [Chloroflexi bacterium]|nr:helix-turn-helix domain-containing protein [Chloroflexota bacterium]